MKRKKCKHNYTLLGMLSKDKKMQIWCSKCKSLWKVDIVPTKYYGYHKVTPVRKKLTKKKFNRLIRMIKEE
jgi:hypothetical protein